MINSAATGLDEAGARKPGCYGRLMRNPWSVWEIAAMVAGFVVFWPLGLLALFLKWKNGEMWPGAAAARAPWSGWKKPDFMCHRAMRTDTYANSGNAAFDEYKQAALQRLEEERRKLDEEQKAFAAFVERLRRAKDRDEFERFMAERRAAAEMPQGASA